MAGHSGAIHPARHFPSFSAHSCLGGGFRLPDEPSNTGYSRHNSPMPHQGCNSPPPHLSTKPSSLDPASLHSIPRSYSPEVLQQLNEDGLSTASVVYGSTTINKHVWQHVHMPAAAAEPQLEDQQELLDMLQLGQCSPDPTYGTAAGPWVTTTFRSSLAMGHSLWDHDGTDFTLGRATQKLSATGAASTATKRPGSATAKQHNSSSSSSYETVLKRAGFKAFNEPGKRARTSQFSAAAAAAADDAGALCPADFPLELQQLLLHPSRPHMAPTTPPTCSSSSSMHPPSWFSHTPVQILVMERTQQQEQEALFLSCFHPQPGAKFPQRSARLSRHKQQHGTTATTAQRQIVLPLDTMVGETRELGYSVGLHDVLGGLGDGGAAAGSVRGSSSSSPEDTLSAPLLAATATVAAALDAGMISQEELLDLIHCTKQQQHLKPSPKTTGGSHDPTRRSPAAAVCHHAGSDASSMTGGTLYSDDDDGAEPFIHLPVSSADPVLMGALPQEQAEEDPLDHQLDPGGHPANIPHGLDSVSVTAKTISPAEQMLASAADPAQAASSPYQDALGASSSPWWGSDLKLAPLVRKLLQSPAGAAVVSSTSSANPTRSSSSSSKTSPQEELLFLGSQTLQVLYELLQQDLLATPQTNSRERGHHDGFVSGVVMAGMRSGTRDSSSDMIGASAGASIHSAAAAGGPEVLHARWVRELGGRAGQDRFQQLEREAMLLRVKQKAAKVTAPGAAAAAVRAVQ